MYGTKKRVLYVCSEMNPFIKLSSVADIARILPEKIQQKDHEIRVLMPRFGLINERRNRLHEVVRLSGINITIDDNDNPLTIKVASIPEAKMQVYFLDNADFFQRKAAFKNEKEEFFADNDERVIFFCKGTLETVKKLGWAPDIIHCQGWMTSLIPMYMKTLYKDEPVFKNAKVVSSMFDNQFEEGLGKDFARKASLNKIEDKHMTNFVNANCMSMYKGAVSYSDAVVMHDDVHPEVLKMAGNLSIPSMRHSDEHLADTYSQFYEQLLSQRN